MSPTDRDQEFLHAIAVVGPMTAVQVAKVWWKDSPNGERCAERLLELSWNGWLAARDVVSYPVLPLRAPILNWRPGDSEPDSGHVSYVLKRRWVGKVPRVTRIYFATQRTHHVLGVKAREGVLRPWAITHDLHVSQLYINLLLNRPELADRWVSEDRMKGGYRQVVPDGGLVDEKGRLRLLIEFGGAYRRERIERLWLHAANKALDLQIF